jgi:hypothetical protein
MLPPRIIRHFAPISIRKRSPMEEYNNVDKYFTSRMRIWLSKTKEI